MCAPGGRPLVIDEIAELNMDDKDTYKRWMKKKGGAKGAKDKDRKACETPTPSPRTRTV